jgi:hypothetical protein
MEQMDVKERTAKTYIKFKRENGLIERTLENPQEYRQITLPFK